LTAVIIGLLILVPMVPELVGKALVLIGAAIGVGCLYYMSVIPGWHPGAKPSSKTWALTKFSAFTFCVVSSK